MVSDNPRVEFHFDFGSPNAYLSHRVIPGIEQRTGVRFQYVPILLGGVFKLTGNRSPVESFAGIRNKLEYQQLETERFIRRHGIDDYRFNPHFPVNTLMLMRGAIAAARLGVPDRYVDEMYRHMWSEPKKLDDPEVLRATLEQAGFDSRQFFDLMQQPQIKEQLQANTARSVGRGAFGSPTFFVGDDIYLDRKSVV